MSKKKPKKYRVCQSAILEPGTKIVHIAKSGISNMTFCGKITDSVTWKHVTDTYNGRVKCKNCHS